MVVSTSSSSPTSNSSSSINSIYQLNSSKQHNQFQHSKTIFNCDIQLLNNNENSSTHFQNIINNQEILNFSNNFYNQKELSEKPLSLCDFNSNGQSSGPSSTLSTSSSTSLTSQFCASLNSSYFPNNNNSNSNENNTHQKDDKNPINRLYSMQSSYFCSKC